jgi:hypothetical protein
MYVLENLLFEVQPQRFPELSLLHFYLWRLLKTLLYSASTDMEETLHQLNSNARRLLANAPGPMKACGSP